jgi:hypothetical protein
MSGDWSQITTLYEEMVAGGVVPASPTSLITAAAYIKADEMSKALLIIESLAEDAPTGGARLFWAHANMIAERWETALDFLQAPMPIRWGLDSERHYHMCMIYLLTNRLVELKHVMKQRKHLCRNDLNWLREMDIHSKLVGGYNYVNEDLVLLCNGVMLHAVFGDIIGALQYMVILEPEIENMLFELLITSCEAHEQTHLLPLLKQLRENPNLLR